MGDAEILNGFLFEHYQYLIWPDESYGNVNVKSVQTIPYKIVYTIIQYARYVYETHVCTQ